MLSNGLKFRVRELQEFENIFYSFKNNVIFMRTPIAQALRLSCSKESQLSNIFLELATEIEKGDFYNIIDVVKIVFEKNKLKLYLNQSDLDMIYDFFENFENNNLDSFENLFNIFVKRINQQLKDAIEIKTKNNKMYSSLGIGIAAMIVIFLI